MNAGGDKMFTNIKNFFNAYELDSNEITEAEKQMEIQIPEDLKKFYQEVGYGFVKNEGGAINRLIGPLGCADIRLRNDYYEYDLDLEMYESFETDKMIFFEVNEGVYMSIGINDGKIYFTDKQVAETLSEFLEKMVDPDYWTEVI